MTSRDILHKITARYKNNKLYAKLLEVSGKKIANYRWIFIVGCYNSGTTLLDQILSDNESISGLPDEGVMLTNQLVRPEDFSWRRMWWKCEKEMDNALVNIEKDPKVVKKHWSHFYDLEKPFLVEKSISNSLRIPFFAQHFKPAFFIHIVRNGYAVAEGIGRKASIMEDNPLYEKEEKYPIELCINQWVRSLQKIEEEKDHIDNFLEIKYEDLTANPGEVINQIMDFLNLPHVNKDYFKNSFEVHEKKSTIKNMNNDSLKRLTEDDIRIINEIAGPYLEKYSYKVITQ